MTLQEYFARCAVNPTIFNAVVKANTVLNDHGHERIAVSISGGADSDVVLDICEKVAKGKCHYMFFDTGIEYAATKRHLKYLEEKYDITIEKIRAPIPVPLGNKKFGQPFMDKQTSTYIETLQKCNFGWDDSDDYIALIKKYCKELDYPKAGAVKIGEKYYKGCVCGILWWCSVVEETPWGRRPYTHNNYCINKHDKLKEFMIANSPNFKISSKCCRGAKKDAAHNYVKDHDIDLNVIGVRNAEGGVRATAYKSCYDCKTGGGVSIQTDFLVSKF